MSGQVKTVEDLRKLQEEQQSDRLKELRDLREVMATKAGQRVIMRILEESKHALSTYDDNPYTSYYKQGRRAVGLVIYNDLMETCPELFWEAQQEKPIRH